jgi:hypothetical protein
VVDERQVLLDLDAAGLVHHGVVGERAERADGEREVVAVLVVVTRRAVAELQTRLGKAQHRGLRHLALFSTPS